LCTGTHRFTIVEPANFSVDYSAATKLSSSSKVIAISGASSVHQPPSLDTPGSIRNSIRAVKLLAKLVAVAVANKMARIAWAIMA
jgi:hypothetical protein